VQNASVLLEVIEAEQLNKTLELVKEKVGGNYRSEVLDGRYFNSIIEQVDYLNSIQTEFGYDTDPWDGNLDNDNVEQNVQYVKGQIAAVSVSNVGEDYDAANTIITVVGDGSGAILEPTIINGEITAINVVNRGKNYSTANIVITDNSYANANVDANGNIIVNNVVPGPGTIGLGDHEWDSTLEIISYEGVFNTDTQGNVTLRRKGEVVDGFDGATFQRVLYGSERPEEFALFDPLENIVMTITTSAYQNGDKTTGNIAAPFAKEVTYRVHQTLFGDTDYLRIRDESTTSIVTKTFEKIAVTEATANANVAVTIEINNMDNVYNNMNILDEDKNVIGNIVDFDFENSTIDVMLDANIAANQNILVAEKFWTYGSEIEIVNDKILIEPSTRTPGTIWIGSEKIEYARRVGNVISLLTRGASGTTIQDHPYGTLVYDAEQRELFNNLDPQRSVWLRDSTIYGEKTPFSEVSGALLTIKSVTEDNVDGNPSTSDKYTLEFFEDLSGYAYTFDVGEFLSTTDIKAFGIVESVDEINNTITYNENINVTSVNPVTPQVNQQIIFSDDEDVNFWNEGTAAQDYTAYVEVSTTEYANLRINNTDTNIVVDDLIAAALIYVVQVTNVSVENGNTFITVVDRVGNDLDTNVITQDTNIIVRETQLNASGWVQDSRDYWDAAEVLAQTTVSLTDRANVDFTSATSIMRFLHNIDEDI